LSSNEGTVATPVAMTFAHPALTAPVATSVPRMARLIEVAMADTAE
jgi:hypothetical protein